MYKMTNYLYWLLNIHINAALNLSSNVHINSITCPSVHVNFFSVATNVYKMQMNFFGDILIQLFITEWCRHPCCNLGISVPS